VWNTQCLVFEVGRSRSIIDKKSLQIKIIEKQKDLRSHFNTPDSRPQPPMATEAYSEVRRGDIEGRERRRWGVEMTSRAMDGLTLAIPQIADAADPSEALAKARYQIKAKSELPLEALIYFLDPFREPMGPSRALKKMLLELKVLGMGRLGSFMDFSEREVGMRWSHWGKRLWLSVHGYTPLLEPKIKTIERFTESYFFPEESTGTLLEPLYFISKQLLQKLQRRLTEQNLGARSLRVSLVGTTYETDFSGSVEFQLTLPAFHHEVSLWLNLLRERLQSLAQQQKLPALLESLEISVDETLLWHGLQKDLLDPQREHREGTLMESLTKLESRLGEKRVFCAEPFESYRPERSWVRRPINEWYQSQTRRVRAEVPPRVPATQVYEILSQKPLQVFPTTERVLFKEKQILFNNQWEPCRLIWSEILSGEFWAERFERRYGVVYLEGGEKLWVFKEGEDIFLQGMFL
jgi:hypothetical protein